MRRGRDLVLIMILVCLTFATSGLSQNEMNVQNAEVIREVLSDNDFISQLQPLTVLQELQKQREKQKQNYENQIKSQVDDFISFLNSPSSSNTDSHNIHIFNEWKSKVINQLVEFYLGELQDNWQPLRGDVKNLISGPNDAFVKLEQYITAYIEAKFYGVATNIAANSN